MVTTGNAVLVVCRQRARLAVHALALVLCGVGTARAATIIVSAPADDTTSNGNCTLREAVIAANTDAAVDACAAGSGADVITVPAGTYLLTLVGAGEDAAATGDLDVTADVEIQGAGAASASVDGNLTDRVFDFDPAATGITAQLSGITVRGGDQVSEGGGIRNAGTLTVADSTITANRVISVSIAQGGGIRSSGNLTVIRSMVVDNITELPASAMSGVFAQGGGIHSDGSATIIATTVDGNTVIADFSFSGTDISGGGIYGAGLLNIDASAVTNNTAHAVQFQDAFGGGILSRATSLTLTNSTISGNLIRGKSAPAPLSQGGGLGVFAGTATISNCTFADNEKFLQPLGGAFVSGISVLAAAIFRNTIVEDNCDTFFGPGTVIGDAYNLARDNSCGFSGSDVTGVDPLLGPLQDNGGPTFTHTLLPLSPAREAGSPAVPGSGGTACEADDQRGVARPQRARCDVGSVEVGPCPTTPLAGCDTPGKSLLLIKDRDADGAGAKDKLTWKWLKGPAAVQADFGNPTTTAEYTLCIYTGAPQAATIEAFVPAGGTCGSAACWKALGTKGYRRSDPAAGAGGVAKIILKGGTSAKITAKGKGANLDIDAGTLPLSAGDVLVQLSNSDNTNCWQSALPMGSVKANSETLFKAKTP
jgi:CSLREA domain-containing protein